MILLLILLAFCTVMMVRNQFVFDERMKMNELMFAQEDYLYYVSIKHTVSYDSMMWHFWIWPIHKMWPEELQKLRDNN